MAFDWSALISHMDCKGEGAGNYRLIKLAGVGDRKWATYIGGRICIIPCQILHVVSCLIFWSPNSCL